MTLLLFFWFFENIEKDQIKPKTISYHTKSNFHSERAAYWKICLKKTYHKIFFWFIQQKYSNHTNIVFIKLKYSEYSLFLCSRKGLSTASFSIVLHSYTCERKIYRNKIYLNRSHLWWKRKYYFKVKSLWKKKISVTSVSCWHFYIGLSLLSL